MRCWTLGRWCRRSSAAGMWRWVQARTSWPWWTTWTTPPSQRLGRSGRPARGWPGSSGRRRRPARQGRPCGGRPGVGGEVAKRRDAHGLVERDGAVAVRDAAGQQRLGGVVAAWQGADHSPRWRTSRDRADAADLDLLAGQGTPGAVIDAGQADHAGAGHRAGHRRQRAVPRRGGGWPAGGVAGGLGFGGRRGRRRRRGLDGLDDLDGPWGAAGQAGTAGPGAPCPAPGAAWWCRSRPRTRPGPPAPPRASW